LGELNLAGVSVTLQPSGKETKTFACLSEPMPFSGGGFFLKNQTISQI
jgi:hypothetical protein